ncbi:MAG: ABC transporter ATP-binding protein [Omnitrophica WOR_2 bacterium]
MTTMTQPDPGPTGSADPAEAQGSSPHNGIVIQVEELWRVYQVGAQEISALRGINLSIPAGQYVALKGRSGSGKTTLLNCLGGLDKPTSGSVKVLGQDLSKMDDRSLTHWRREQVGLVFQSFGLLPTLSAYENVELMLRIKGTPGKERHQQTLSTLELVGLTKWMHHRPYEMSGGQQQRVALARALVNQPRLILADEPTGELDTTTAREMFSLFGRIVESEGITLLMASHDPIADEYVNRVLHLKDGRIGA